MARARLLAPCSLALLALACNAEGSPFGLPDEDAEEQPQGAIVAWPFSAQEPEPPVPEGVHVCGPPRLAVALVLGRSGSTSGAPLEVAKAGALEALERLGDRDLVEVIAVDGEPLRVVKLQPARHRARIAAAIEGIQPGGGAGIFQALDTAYLDLWAGGAGEKHVVLLTDGAPAEGAAGLVVSAMVEDGIAVSAFALGASPGARATRAW